MLKNKTKVTIFTLVFIAIIGVAYSFYFNNQQIESINKYSEFSHLFAAGTYTPNVYGWAYSPIIGPISLNSDNCDSDNNGYVDATCGGDNATDVSYDYGIEIEMDGDLTGYAWSESVGPISFNISEICDSDGCQEADFPDSTLASDYSAKVVWYSSGVAKIRGWARALSACSFNGTTCTTLTDGTNAGGWDGWIKFDSDLSNGYSECVGGECGGGDKYNTMLKTVSGVNEINGNAWGGVLPGEEAEVTPAAVIGEIIFVDATTDFDPDNVCASQEPEAAFHAVCLNGNIEDGTCYYSSGEDLILDNDSVDPDTANCGAGENIASSDWTGTACDGSGITNCDITPVSGSQTISLEVEDYQENIDSISHTLNFIPGLIADFSCCIPTESVDCSANSHFVDCNDYVSRTIIEGTTMFLKDNVNVPDYSVVTSGASIFSRSWTYDGGSIAITGAINELCELLVTQDGVVEMTVSDDTPLTDTQILDFSEFGNIVADPEFVEK